MSTLLRNVGASMRNWQVLRVHEATGRLDLAGTLAMTPALLARAARTTAVLALAVLVQAADVHTADAQPAPSSLRTIERLDVPRYMGTWYEIAKFPNRFQSQCTSDTRAEYAAQPDGTVRVVNRCRTEGGKTTEAVGLARQVGGPDSPKLQVRFAPAWLSWLPAVWGDYWIVDLDPDYQLVAVSEPSRKYLWILARSPHVDPAREGAMLKRLAEQGLDISRLQPTPHATQAPVGGWLLLGRDDQSASAGHLRGRMSAMGGGADDERRLARGHVSGRSWPSSRRGEAIERQLIGQNCHPMLEVAYRP